jgi:hypothetical protein
VGKVPTTGANGFGRRLPERSRRRRRTNPDVDCGDSRSDGAVPERTRYQFRRVTFATVRAPGSFFPRPYPPAMLRARRSSPGTRRGTFPERTQCQSRGVWFRIGRRGGSPERTWRLARQSPNEPGMRCDLSGSPSDVRSSVGDLVRTNPRPRGDLLERTRPGSFRAGRPTPGGTGRRLGTATIGQAPECNRRPPDRH